MLFLSHTFIFDPSFHCSQETQGNKTPQNKIGCTRKSCTLPIQLFLKNTKERLLEKTTQQQLPERTLEASALSMVFAMSLYAEQWHGTIQMKPAVSAHNVSESSTSTLAAPRASLCCSTIAFLIGIKCDSRQLFPWGCYFRTVYLNLTWHPRAPCAACPRPAFLLLPAQRQGTHLARQAGSRHWAKHK